MSDNTIMQSTDNCKSLFDNANKLANLNYLVVGGHNEKPLYAFRRNITKNSTFKSQAHVFEDILKLEIPNYKSFNSLLIVVNKNMLVLDVDTPEQVVELTRLATKYNIYSNLVIQTKHGYHVYYSVDYEVSSKNANNNSIAIKCAYMPITAPNSFRWDKQYTYKVVSKYEVPDANALNLLPEAMYLELREFNKPIVKPLTTPAVTRIKSNIQHGYYDKEAEYYLSKLDVNYYLFGEIGAWLQVLCACKKLESNDAYEQCLAWTRQGRYSDISDIEFRSIWQSTKGVNNGGAWLNSAIRRR